MKFKEGSVKIGIGQGHLKHYESDGENFVTWYDDTICPMGSRQYNSLVVKELPPIDEIYEMMVGLGYGPEEIIDELLAIYHRYRNFKVDYLADTELTIGFIGYRGTAKSGSISKVAAEDGLLAGRQVWSNMDIKFDVVYKDAKKSFSTEPISKMKLLKESGTYQNGIVILDEVNQDFAEASRYMSSTNLETANTMQEMRKLGLDVIWSAQNWNTIDPRLRFQSDFIVLCSLARPEHKGIWSYWRVMDSTGLSGKLDFDLEFKSHYLLDKVVSQGSVWIRPWWLVFNSGQRQRTETYNIKQAMSQKEFNDKEKVLERVQKHIESGGEEIRCYDFYASMGCLNDRALQSEIGRMFSENGYKRSRDSVGTYWRPK